MPVKGMPPKEVVHTEMHKFKEGTLHSGSKTGPKVKNRKQAIAIALSEAGKSKGAVDRSAHHKGNPGFPSSSEAGGSPPPATYKTHESREREVMGAGYKQHERQSSGAPHTFRAPAASGAHSFSGTKKCGNLRVSGKAGAHMIGCRGK